MRKLICLLLLAMMAANAGALHKLVYVAQAVTVVASLGVDGYSTERCIGVPGIRETNPLFVDGSGRFSQYRFWTIKSIMSLAPIAFSYIAHKKRNDNTTTDLVSIASSGILTLVYTRAGVHNMSLVDSAGAR